MLILNKSAFLPMDISDRRCNNNIIVFLEYLSYMPQTLLTLHILVSLIAFGFLGLAAMQAGLLYIQNHILKSGTSLKLLKFLPPLQSMETFLFRIIALGFIFLSISLMTASTVINELYTVTQPYKILFSILAWAFFAILILGRLRSGWRGKTAIKWTLSGMVILIVAYFSSKLIFLHPGS
jgi:ABC-type uncharacterized transport system permease subunit